MLTHDEFYAFLECLPRVDSSDKATEPDKLYCVSGPEPISEHSEYCSLHWINKSGIEVTVCVKHNGEDKYSGEDKFYIFYWNIDKIKIETFPGLRHLKALFAKLSTIKDGKELKSYLNNQELGHRNEVTELGKDF